MNKTPTPTGAVALIRLAREGNGITVERAARTAGISKSRWIQIEKGYETRQGMIKPARAKAGTIARMAHAVGLSPERLETEGQDPDAAAILREIIRRSMAPRPETVPEGYAPAVVPGAAESLPDQVDRVWLEVADAAMVHRVRADLLTGAQVFGDTDDAAIWDSYGALNPAWRVRTVALARATREAVASAAASRRAAEAG